MTRDATEYPVLRFNEQAEWSAWLEQHHGTAKGVWLQLAKKASTRTSVSYAEALDVALCYGWIDGQKKGYDADSWLQKFTPRGPKSIWSKINRDKAETLIKRRRMKPAGLAAIKQAKGDGRWEQAYDAQSSATVPGDFQAALDACPEAKMFFETLKSDNRYAILFRIQTAKKSETRTRRIERFIAMLERHETVHP